MRYNNINNINKEAPITYKIRINQPLFMFILNYFLLFNQFNAFSCLNNYSTKGFNQYNHKLSQQWPY